MSVLNSSSLRSKSAKIYETSCQLIPGGVNSPVRAFPGLNQVPLIVDSGYQEMIMDVDGRRYIDYCCSWGALIHGHANPRIVEAAQKQIAKGSSFGIATEIEAKLAKKITSHVPSVEKLRFVSSGTEATMSAVRLARGYTQRDFIIKFSGNYHGHADSFLVQAGSGALNVASSAGVPHDFIKNTLSLPYNDLNAVKSAFREHSSQIAAVIVEPIAANMGLIPPLPGFLETLREECRKVEALLIFDEVITGFRVALGGAQGIYGIDPDLTCFGKIIGGGFPAAAFGGKREIMDHLAPLGDVYQAGTLSGNPVAMEAGFQALLLLETPGFYETLENNTALIIEPLKEHIAEHDLNACVQHIGSLFTIFFGIPKATTLEDVKKCNPEYFNAFFKSLFEEGIYCSPSQYEANFVSSAHGHQSLVRTRDIMQSTISQF